MGPDRGSPADGAAGGSGLTDPSTVRFEDAVRAHSGRILAALVGRFRDLTLAEESLQDAWLAAAEHWPVDGWPDRPDSWVYAVAARRALDTIKANRRRYDRERVAHEHADRRVLDDVDRRLERWDSGIDDDRLRLIFTCCHPCLDVEAQIALTLRSVAWLTTDEIASAFGVPTSTMAQRIVRAKQRIARADVPYRVPSGAELPERIDAVLRVVYLVFNESYLSARPGRPLRVDLADEAIRLGRELAELMPDEPEAIGLLALMLVLHGRSPARFDGAGDLVLLADQRRDRWDHDSIAEGSALLEAAMRRRSVGPYQLQAAINALHSQAPTFDETDWTQIEALYGVLASVDPSPVVAMNRAVAIGHASGPEAGLRALDALDPERLPGQHLLHAARAEFLVRLDRHDEARAEFDRALGSVATEPERRHLERRRATLR
ncbi:MAG: RNA polymerase sigma factor [Ilumatobacter fluminis]|uniref:RNA polymerase sigma factor n=1 Tax=Ilumatobacter fluminis TaxID=467091 RepID=UPI0032EACBE2